MKNFDNLRVAIVLSIACLMGTAALAQGPPVNISAARHPHLADAQQQCKQAWTKLGEAQKANDWDMQGNAQRAKGLLVQAAELMKQAAESANQNAHKPKPSSGPTGQAPVLNISPARHPHLAAAQQEIHKAWEKMVEAQKANDWDMDGHAQKAKELLAQATKDLKAAALAANAGGAAKKGK
jgi:hypothetical protein